MIVISFFQQFVNLSIIYIPKISNVELKFLKLKPHDTPQKHT